MIDEKVFNQVEPITTREKSQLVDFLFDHLDEYGDKKEHIHMAIDYAMNTNPMAGGFILQSSEDDEITGAVVINKTGMKGYIPENILVYIAVRADQRGRGLGKKLMERTMQLAKGDIALHVEENNPANFLYKKMGFVNPYLEMRYYSNGAPVKNNKSQPA
ncbi:MAG: GNAT family N-acetyltransferase [Bacteroidales bacterium]|nr:GNAT family N-acetyltransferase [Bacteroidales bacterium]